VLSDGSAAYFRFGEISTAAGAVDETGHHNRDYRSVNLRVSGAIGGDANTAAQFQGTPDSEVYLGDEYTCHRVPSQIASDGSMNPPSKNPLHP